MIGLKRKTIKLLPHHKSWDLFFTKEKENIIKNIPDIYVEHVGSTAIPSIVAKPIIDIAIGINKMKNFSQYKKQLEKLGYKYHDNRGSRFNKFFTKGPADCRTAYIHLVKYKGKYWNNYINFRNKLNAAPKLAKQYQTLKIKLSTKHTNRDAYTKEKANFINNVNK